MRWAARRAAAALVLAALGAASSACEWFENMADQPSVQTFEQAPRPPVAGTVPVDAELPPAVSFEVANTLPNPLEPTGAVVARGGELYATYCVVCHGATGAGDGPVVPSFVRPPTLMGASRGFTDGYLYALLTNGRGNMPSYNRMVPDERWAVIHYLRRLQSGAAGDAAQAGEAVGPPPNAPAPAPAPAPGDTGA